MHDADQHHADRRHQIAARHEHPKRRRGRRLQRREERVAACATPPAPQGRGRGTIEGQVKRQ
jgi:hypothetical protein